MHWSPAVTGDASSKISFNKLGPPNLVIENAPILMACSLIVLSSRAKSDAGGAGQMKCVDMCRLLRSVSGIAASDGLIRIT